MAALEELGESPRAAAATVSRRRTSDEARILFLTRAA
jgi:hypothetical protein